MTQYLACKFSPVDGCAYTYHNDGEPLAVGDMAKVASSRDPSAWKRVRVEAIVDKPGVETKPILGKVEDAPAQDGGE